MAKKIKQAEKLIQDVDKKIRTWNERSQFRLKGVGNLSKSDMDTLKMYAETFIRSGGYGFTGLMGPTGSTRDIFVQYGIITEGEDY